MSHTEIEQPSVTLPPLGEAFQPASGNFNALLKQSAEKLLPLLGQQIRLRLFCASDVFQVVMQPSQMDDILGCLFVKAKDDMQTGGTVLLQTGDDVGSHVVVTFSYTACEADDDENDAPLQAVRDIVEDSRGFVSLDCIPYQETSIRIHLPVFDRFEALPTRHSQID